MTVLTVGISAALFGLKLLTSPDVIKITKQLVENIDNKNIPGDEKFDWVMQELQKFFNNLVPILLKAVIEITVIQLQNDNGTLEKKIKELNNGQSTKN